MKPFHTARVGLVLAITVGLAACGAGGGSDLTASSVSGPTSASGGGSPPSAPLAGWAWISGADTTGAIAVYGTPGTSGYLDDLWMSTS